MDTRMAGADRGRMGARLARAALAVLAGLSVAATPGGTASDLTADRLSAVERQVEWRAAPPGHGVLTSADEQFLDDLERRGVRYFTDEADRDTGLMPDRAAATGGRAGVCSVAAVGFGLTALCVADHRRWLPHPDAYDRCLRAVRFLAGGRVETVHGFYYHFLDLRSGRRAWNCELSSIDTGLLVAGAMTAREQFPGTELATVAGRLCDGVDWPWMMDGGSTLAMGWTPEAGFLKSRWDAFNEGPLLYLLALGSPTHPLPAAAWDAWRRGPLSHYGGLTYLSCPPLFTHQYPQCWFDLRGLRDDHANYTRDSVLATLAQRQWCADELSRKFADYGPDLWGLTASDGPTGYQAWGGPPARGVIDGTVVPAAAGGSLPFAPRQCLDALEHMRSQYGATAYLKYGFVDAFNPLTRWANRDVLGIDVGPTIVMAENCRSAYVWETFGRSPEVAVALRLARFRSALSEPSLGPATSIYGVIGPDAGR
jgi:hypothetical protein